MSHNLSNRRKAVASRDDCTLTRFVKEPQRHSKPSRTGLAPLDATGTRFPSRVMPIEAMSSILVSGHSNVKIGRDVRKGRLKGYWVYTLSLEERATCPKSCAHWRSCYGNAMPFAKRVDHTDPAFLPTLRAEIGRLLNVRGRRGVLIRLHALGDFYSEAYVEFWRELLGQHINLSLYGYTARQGAIGAALDRMNAEYGERCMIRYSGHRDSMAAVGIKAATDCPENAFVCPEQTGKTTCCATCGACWATTKNVAFLEH